MLGRKRKAGSELLGVDVWIPGRIFNIDDSSKLHGKVKGHDAVHKGHMIVKCDGDPRRFFFPVDQVAMWAHQDDVKDNKDEDDEQSRSLTDGEQLRPSGPAQVPASAEEKQLGGASGSKRPPRRQPESEPGGGGERRHKSLPAAALTASAPLGTPLPPEQPGGAGDSDGYLPVPAGSKGSLRPHKRGRRDRHYTGKGEVADLIGKVVDVPGWVFRVEVPQLFYPGRVLGPDHSHASSVVVKVAGDPTKFYFPCKDVRGWLRAMELRLGQEKGQRAHRTTGPQTDKFAAEVLTRMSAESGGGSPLSSVLGGSAAAVGSSSHQQRQQRHEGAATSRPRLVAAAAGAVADKGAFDASSHGWDALKMMADVAATGAVPPLQEGEVAEPGHEGGSLGGGPSGRPEDGSGWLGQQAAAGFGAPGYGLVLPAADFGSSGEDTANLPSSTSSVQIPAGYLDYAAFGTAPETQALFGTTPGSFFVMPPPPPQQQYFLQPQPQQQYHLAPSHPLLLHPLGGEGYLLPDYERPPVHQGLQLDHRPQQGPQLPPPRLHLGLDALQRQQQQQQQLGASSTQYGNHPHPFTLAQLTPQQPFSQPAAQHQSLYAIPVIQLSDLQMLAWHNQQQLPANSQQLQGSFRQFPQNNSWQLHDSFQQLPQANDQQQLRGTNQHQPPPNFQQTSIPLQPQASHLPNLPMPEAPRITSTMPLNAPQPQENHGSGAVFAGGTPPAGDLAGLPGSLGSRLHTIPHFQGSLASFGGAQGLSAAQPFRPPASVQHQQPPAAGQYQHQQPPAAGQYQHPPVAGHRQQLPPDATGTGVAVANAVAEGAVQRPQNNNGHLASWMACPHAVPSTPGSQGDWAARVSDEGNLLHALVTTGDGRGHVHVQAPASTHRMATTYGIPAPHGNVTAASANGGVASSAAGMPPRPSAAAHSVVLDLALPRG